MLGGALPATTTSERIRFNIINRKTGNRIRNDIVDAETGKPVEPEDRVKGYPYEKADSGPMAVCGRSGMLTPPVRRVE